MLASVAEMVKAAAKVEEAVLAGVDWAAAEVVLVAVVVAVVAGAPAVAAVT